MENIEKARIEILDLRKEKAGNPEERKAVSAGAAGTSQFGKSEIMLKAASSALSDSMGREIGVTTIKGTDRKVFTVQFNPSDFQLSGSGGDYITKNDYSVQDGKDGVSGGGMEMRITLDVKLIFDKVDPHTAFLSDRINTAPTALGMDVERLFTEKNASVQTEVEGFIAALRSPYTRMITFAWGKMCYTGVLSGVDAQYTMFDVDGKPVRAEVTLQITTADEQITPCSMGSWEQKYKAAFGAGSFSMTGLGQKVGSLLNLNW